MKKMIKKLYGMDAVDAVLEKYYKSLFVVAITPSRINKITISGAINTMNMIMWRFPTCASYNYLMSYFDEETHNLIMLFQKYGEEGEKEK